MRGRASLCATGVLLALAACSTTSDVTVGPPGSGQGEQPSATDAPAVPGTGPDTGSGTDASSVAWGPCEESDRYDVDGWECGTIEVPLDYEATTAESEGDTVTLALSRLPATDADQRVGSLLVNPGGPGASGIEALHYLAPELPDELMARFDLVGFDPRGVGQSTPVDCFGDRARDAEADLDPTPDTPEEIAAMVDRLSETAETCASAQGDLLPYVGTMNAARDLDRLRAAVGDERLSYIGFSYGTSLGATYADLFPERVRALVLDGAVDPAAGVDDTGTQQGGSYGDQDFQEAFTRFAEACAAATECAAGPDPQALLDQVRAAVEAAPIDAPTVEAADGRKLTVGLFETGVVAALYDTSSWPFLAVGLRDAANGDGSALVFLADNLNDRDPDGTWSNLFDAFRAIGCADFPARPTAEQVTAEYTAVMGTGEGVPSDQPSPACLDWPATAEPLAVIGPADTADPLLVIGTRGDPATPYAFAEDMAEALGNAVMLTWEGDGHTAFPKTTCIKDAVTSYLVDLTVPAAGTTCPASDDGATDPDVGSAYDLDRAGLQTQIEEAFRSNGTPDDLAACIAEGLTSGLDETELVHFFIGLESDELVGKLQSVAEGCGGVLGS